MVISMLSAGAYSKPEIREKYLHSDPSTLFWALGFDAKAPDREYPSWLNSAKRADN